MIQREIGGVRVTMTTPRVSGAEAPPSAVVLFHGYCVPGTDLVCLGDTLRYPEHTCLVFPEGLLDLGTSAAAAGANARGCWPANSNTFKVAMLTGQAHLAARSAGLGRESARNHVLTLLDALQTELGVAPERIVLGGFSQGAILCLDVALHDLRRWAGLLLMSGTLASRDDIRERAAHRGRTRVLITHGTSDPILPLVMAEELNCELVRADWDVTFLPFEGSHGIPPCVLDAASRAIHRWLN